MCLFAECNISWSITSPSDLFHFRPLHPSEINLLYTLWQWCWSHITPKLMFSFPDQPSQNQTWMKLKRSQPSCNNDITDQETHDVQKKEEKKVWTLEKSLCDRLLCGCFTCVLDGKEDLPKSSLWCGEQKEWGRARMPRRSKG